jgi:transposase-like protein
MQITNYSTHCPHCDSEDITMINNPEYNDEWGCNDCKGTFDSYKVKQL